jgi:hypothetical protein
MLFVPSVEVTKGDEQPLWLAVQMFGVMLGGLPGLMRKAGIAALAPRKATYVPWLVR